MKILRSAQGSVALKVARPKSDMTKEELAVTVSKVRISGKQIAISYL